MSTNNQLIILKNDLHEKNPYEVHEDLCVDNEFEPTGETILDRFEDLVEAIMFANEYCRENIVEYGYSIEKSALLKSKENK